MESVAYLSLDAHARSCTLGNMNAAGFYVSEDHFQTSEAALVSHVIAVKARRKVFTVEEGPMAAWICRTLHEYVDEIIVCDPRENSLISRHANKGDSIDAYNLCRLLRLGELKGVYHPLEDERAVFKSAVQQYVDVRDQLTAMKNKIKAKYRQWGVVSVEGRQVFGRRSRGRYLAQLQQGAVRHSMEHYYALLDALEDGKQKVYEDVVELGRSYGEIAEFQRIPGIGPVGAHIFDAYVQTPYRFPTKQTLWRYCRLGVIHRTSDNRPVGRKRLDRSGHAILKDMTYRAWLGSLNRKDDNEVKAFFERSLARTKNRTHARLNTQRKIITVLWTIWKTGEAYKPKRFLSDTAEAELRAV